MAITGILHADFSEFVSEAQKAEGSMQRMAGGASTVESSLNRMATSPIAPMNTLRGSFSQVDQVLNASGVNIGKYARGLVEIEDMAGKTVGQLGLLATAASVFGAAMAGWNFGRAAAGFLGTDKIIGDLTAKLFGLGDVAGQETAAGLDAMALATSRTDHAVTNMSEALAVNSKFVMDRADALEAEAEAAANAVRPESDLMRQWNDSAEAADGYIGAWTDLHEASIVYGDGLPEVTEKTETLTEVFNDMHAVMGPLQEGFRFTSTTVGELGDKLEALQTKLKITAEETRSFQSSAANLAGGTHSIQPLTQSQLLALAPPAAGTGRIDEGKIWAKLAQLERLEGTYAPKTGEEYMRMINDQVLLSQLRQWAQGKDRPPGLAMGTDNWQGGMAIVGERGPELVNLPKGSSVTPNNKLGGSITVNISSVMGNPQEIARLVKSAIVDAAKMTGQRIATGTA